MRRETVFLCGGQGSQFYGMGRDLYRSEPFFREELQSLDDMARPLLGCSVVDVLYGERSPAERFDDTLTTHPAIFMLEVALGRLLISRGVEPDILVGSSLGEFACLALAGAVPVSSLLRACVLQARVLTSRCAPGGMVAVLHELKSYLQSPGLPAGATIASVNLEQHFVLSGTVEVCDAVERDCQRDGIIQQRLPVRIAFHSPMMDVARSEFLEQVADLAMTSPRVPVLSTTLGRERRVFDKGVLWDVAREPMRVDETLAALSRLVSCDFVDLTPGATLGTLLKHAKVGNACQVFPVVTPFHADLRVLERVLAERGSCSELQSCFKRV